MSMMNDQSLGEKHKMLDPQIINKSQMIRVQGKQKEIKLKENVKDQRNTSRTQKHVQVQKE